MQMSQQAAFPASSRASMRNSHLRSPLLRSLVAFALALGVLVLQVSLELEATSYVALALSGAAVIAALAGVLVLAQSAAINRIRTLRMESKRQVDEIVRGAFYSEQLGEALGDVHELRESAGRGNVVELADRLIQTAARRTAVVFDPSVCFYLVESTAQWHIVRAASGTTRFDVEAGKRCPGDRSLDEALSGIGNYWHAAPLTSEGTKYSLVLLADRSPSHAERTLVNQLALVLSFSEAAPVRGGRLGRRSGTQLRVV
jgi:hypothetical protein